MEKFQLNKARNQIHQVQDSANNLLNHQIDLPHLEYINYCGMHLQDGD